MIGFLLGSAAVIGFAGLFMILAPQRSASTMRFIDLTNDPAALRTYRIGGGVLVALAVILLITPFLPE